MILINKYDFNDRIIVPNEKIDGDFGIENAIVYTAHEKILKFMSKGKYKKHEGELDFTDKRFFIMYSSAKFVKQGRKLILKPINIFTEISEEEHMKIRKGE